MKIKLLAIGKTDDKNLIQLIDNYQNRLKHYIKFELEIIPDIKNVKNLSEAQQKEKEGTLILSKLQNTDQLILLDDKGKHFSSIEFSQYLQKKMNSGIKQLVLVIGGPYGFSDAIYKKSQGKISLSKMTFSHQMIRLFIIEQIYRGYTILRNEPYHHE
ncbi:23S rRNA (pseudouridine(1915)-N(3))-methyltransferase RlmH [uncultured Tenacibaculum sp.]|uniref:23S rRNA (pseudouridine(1915)-N(3))-methyltransferase RlmH n=1 Tax=uncultured Tenacibaculum sp. TaxID=174713 RepID=UPI0026287244|nr:23S rRNA (pseudouridine(1915)-N(3))-methyltransferase RlmH [uncultured Tenacibaculum sp.]